MLFAGHYLTAERGGKYTLYQGNQNIWNQFMTVMTKDKVYIDKPCGSKTLAGFLLMHF